MQADFVPIFVTNAYFPRFKHWKMKPEHFLNRLRDELAPRDDVRLRVKQRLESRIAAPRVLENVKKQLTPTKAQQQTVWSRVKGATAAVEMESLLDRLRGVLTPSSTLRSSLRAQLLLRLSPRRMQVVPYRAMKWTAAMALFLLLVRTSPLIFIAPQTIADSAVTLVPTRGEVSVSIGGLWQPVNGELTLAPGMTLRTHDGEASIIFHDDGVIRLGKNTSIQLHDTNDRLEPASELLPTITLFTGDLWVQGLIPAYLRGITVATTYGHVTVHDGSVSISEDDTVEVNVWNRRAVATHKGEDIQLVAGERLELWDNNIPLVKKISDEAYEDTWVTQNLDRDAVHRREIAQLQQDRRAQRAGILPTSKLYSVKRVAEEVDVLLTLGKEARVQKRLDQANTRLNEAAALIQEGNADIATAPLDDYQHTLLALASGSGDTSLAQFLLQQSVTEMSADVAAALPGDDSYILKKMVLETSAALPDSLVGTSDVQSQLLVDTLAGLTQRVQEDREEDISSVWEELQPYLALLEDDENVPSDIRKEAHSLLAEFAVAIADDIDLNEVDPELAELIETYQQPQAPVVPAMTEEEIMAIVATIRERIFLYDMQRSRVNQLTLELRALEGNPEQGRILRRLFSALPDGPESFPDRIRKEIARLQWENAGTL